MDNKHIFPEWEIVEEIGSGSSGKVYKVRKEDEIGGDYFSALKVVPVPASADEHRLYIEDGYDEESIAKIYKDRITRLVDEFRLMSDFKGNTNIVSYEDHKVVPKEDGVGYYVLIRMELLTTLPNAFNKKPLSEAEIIKLGKDICSALELCEKKNIIHRDIKPQNIFVNAFGDYKLGDFGVAKTKDSNTKATKTGTPAYMAPEMYHGNSYDSTVDIYSLGLVMYWLLNERRLPFLPMPPQVPTAAQSSKAQEQRLNGDALPDPARGSDALKAAVIKACSYEPQARYQTASQFKAVLDAISLLAQEDLERTTRIPISSGTAGKAYTTGNEREYIPQEIRGTAEDAFEKTAVISPAQKPANKPKATPEKKAATPKKAEKPAPVKKAPPARKAVQADENGNVPVKKKRSKKWIIIVVILLLLLLLGFAALALFGGCGGILLFLPGGNGGDSSYVDSDGNSQTVSADSPYAEDIKNVTVKEMPNKTEYYPGESLDLSGLKLEVEYENGEKDVVSSGFTYDDSVLTDVGVKVVTVSYEGFDVEITVEVLEGEITYTLKNGVLTISGYGAMDDYSHSSTADWRSRTDEIKSVVIQNGVTTIGEYAFELCPALKEISIPDSVVSIGAYAFADCEVLDEINVSSGNKEYSSVSGVLFNKDKTVLVQFPTGKSSSSFTVPNTVEVIAERAFYGCSKLKGVTVKDGVEEIGAYAFAYCSSIKSISLPESVTTVGDYAFDHCNSLTSVSLKGVETIGNYAFANCIALKEITLPKTIKTIGNYAFSSCSALSDFRYNGTKEEWFEVSRNNSWKSKAAFNKVQCSDGNVTISG